MEWARWLSLVAQLSCVLFGYFYEWYSIRWEWASQPVSQWLVCTSIMLRLIICICFGLISLSVASNLIACCNTRKPCNSQATFFFLAVNKQFKDLYFIILYIYNEEHFYCIQKSVALFWLMPHNYLFHLNFVNKIKYEDLKKKKIGLCNWRKFVFIYTHIQ